MTEAAATPRRGRAGAPRHVVPLLVSLTMLAVVTLGLAGCGDDGEPADLATFCTRFDELSGASPFAELTIATPGEMRAAFDSLRDSADGLVRVAPADVELAATDYRDAVGVLVAELEAAGFDSRNVDTLTYGRAVDDYSDAAVALDRAAASACAAG